MSNEKNRTLNGTNLKSLPCCLERQVKVVVVLIESLHANVTVLTTRRKSARKSGMDLRKQGQPV